MSTLFSYDRSIYFSLSFSLFLSLFLLVFLMFVRSSFIFFDEFLAYATRLDQILQRKEDLVHVLRQKLHQFRARLIEEENAFKN